MLKLVSTATGAVVSSVGSAVCCSGPVVAAAIGVSGAGLSAFLPYRPLFVGAAVVFLWLGFTQLDREEQKACEPGLVCAAPGVRKRMRLMLWIATVLVLLFGTSARWIAWLL